MRRRGGMSARPTLPCGPARAWAGQPVAWWALGLGLAVLAGAWLGPLPGLAGQAFAAHMAMHVAVVAVGAPLVAIALAGSRIDPARLAPRLLAPIPASLLELVVVWAWHAPALHHAARTVPAALVLEQTLFFAAGLAVWSSAFGAPQAGASRAGAGVAALLLTSMHMTLLGALLTLTPRPLYEHAGRAGHGLLGLGPLEDQQLGGLLMLAAGGTAYLIGGLVLLARLLGTRPMAAGEGP